MKKILPFLLAILTTLGFVVLLQEYAYSGLLKKLLIIIMGGCALISWICCLISCVRRQK